MKESGLVDGIEILTVNVFMEHHGLFGRLERVVDDTRDGDEACTTSTQETTVSGDNLIVPIPSSDHERFNHPDLADGLRERIEIAESVDTARRRLRIVHLVDRQLF